MKHIIYMLCAVLGLGLFLYFYIIDQALIGELVDDKPKLLATGLSMYIHAETWAIIILPTCLLCAVVLPFMYRFAVETANEESKSMLEFYKNEAETADSRAKESNDQQQKQNDYQKRMNDKRYEQLAIEQNKVNAEIEKLKQQRLAVEKQERAINQELREKDNQLAKANRATENARNAFRRLKNKHRKNTIDENDDEFWKTE